MKNKYTLFFLVLLFTLLTYLPNTAWAVPPLEVVTLGDGTTDYILPACTPETCSTGNLYGAELVFSDTPGGEDQTAVQEALATGASRDGSLNYTWNEAGDTLQIYSNTPIIFNTDVVVTIVETELTLIDSSSTSSFDILFAGGNGTEGEPLQIETCQQLQDINYYTLNNYYFILKNNIDCSATSTWNAGAGFMPIGSTYDADNDITYGGDFLGTFDGNDQTISDLFINRPFFKYVGLFGFAGDGNESSSVLIKDLTIENANITAFNAAGILAGAVYGNGENNPSVISNVHTSGEITTSYDGDDAGGTGGLVGYLNSSEITDSSSSATVSGVDVVGGLVGRNAWGHIEDSSAIGNVSGQEAIGGLVGVSVGGMLPGTIINSYATGDVSGTNNVGGLVGINNEDDIILSYATGNVSGTADVGGLVGRNGRGHIEDTYATGEVTGEAIVGGLVGISSGGLLSETIVNSYATGNVTGTESVGGLVGLDTGDEIHNSFSVGSVRGEESVGGLIGLMLYNAEETSADYVFNSGWYQSQDNSELSGIGESSYGEGLDGPQDVTYTETDNQVFFSKDHGVYTQGEEGVWDFATPVWYEYTDNYPKFTEQETPIVITPIIRSGSYIGGGPGAVVPPPANTVVSDCTAETLYSPTTGQRCPVVAEVPGCTTTTLYSPLSGQSCGTSFTPPSTSPTAPDITRILKLTIPRMTGDDVRALQTYLNNAGYDCGIADGIFGPKTKAAVILFQKANGLVGDGVVGPLTKAKLI